MAFLGIGLGQILAVSTQPLFNRSVLLILFAILGHQFLTIYARQYRRTAEASGGKAPPEARLVTGFFGAVLCPFGLLLFGLLSFRDVPWILPILGSSFFGAGMVYAYTGTFTYLVEYVCRSLLHETELMGDSAYRPVAASALASNSFLRSAFAAGFPLYVPLSFRYGGSLTGLEIREPDVCAPRAGWRYMPSWRAHGSLRSITVHLSPCWSTATGTLSACCIVGPDASIWSAQPVSPRVTSRAQ